MPFPQTYFGADRPAVNDLCLAIPKGECFGLLGVNGMCLMFFFFLHQRHFTDWTSFIASIMKISWNNNT